MRQIGVGINPMDGLAQRTIKNSVYGFIGFIWPMILSFIAMPILINRLGSPKYGFYILLNAALGVFGILDVGFNYNFSKKLSENPENSDAKELSNLFSSTFFTYFVIGLIAFASIILMADFFKNILKIPEGFVFSYTLVFFVIGCTFFIRMLGTPITQIPYLLQRIDICSKISLANITLVQVAGILAVLSGRGITTLIMIQFASALLVLLIYIFFWKKLLPALKLKFYFSFGIFRGMFKNGLWICLSNTMMNILTQFDKFVLGVFWGPGSVTYYSASQMIPEKIQGASFSISHIFFPIFSNVSFLGQKEKMVKIFRRAIRVIGFVAAGLATSVLIYGNKLLEFWLGRDFADSCTIALHFLAFTYFLLSFFIFIYFFATGIKALKFCFFSSSCIALLDVVFMFILIPAYKINGAAGAYFLSALAVPFYLYYIEKKIFFSTNRAIFNFYFKTFSKFFIVCLIVYAAGRLALLPMVDNLLSVILIGGLTFLTYLAVFWLFGFFEKEDKDLFAEYFGRLLKKKVL